MLLMGVPNPDGVVIGMMKKNAAIIDCCCVFATVESKRASPSEQKQCDAKANTRYAHGRVHHTTACSEADRGGHCATFEHRLFSAAPWCFCSFCHPRT